ncbi:hypothetical protein B0H19DRAFT_1324230 [Mycena capillaripes]|nr:hypothetical protein B0H19DRAFT_1324230 [Mycena capillaripes]
MQLMNAHQGQQTVRDFARQVQSLAKRVPGINQRHLVQILWDGVEQKIRIRLLDKGMNPEDTSLKRLMKWAVRFETAIEAVENQLSQTHLAKDSEESENEREAGKFQRDPNGFKHRRRKHSQHTEFEEREPKAKITVNAARYEYESSSDSGALYLSARRPHRHPVEREPETSSESEDEEDDDGRSGQEEFSGSESDGRLFESKNSGTESSE